MRFVPGKSPLSGSGTFRGSRRAFTLLFAGLLTLGVLQPITASAGATPQLTVNDKAVVETDHGTKDAEVEIVLSERAKKQVTATFATKDGSAKSGSDYVATSGPVVFGKGTWKAVVRIPVTGDKIKEPDEFFRVRIYDAHKAKVVKGVGIVWVHDDDKGYKPPPPLPRLWVDDTRADEGEDAYFKVSISRPAKNPVRFGYATKDGTAVAGQDYFGATDTARIPRGLDHVFVKVRTIDDTVFEPGPEETFFIQLSDVEHATIKGSSKGRGLIKDDDGGSDLPRVSVSGGGQAVEGGQLTFRVERNPVTNVDVSYEWKIIGGGATCADDLTHCSGSGTISGRAAGTVLIIGLVDDAIDEPQENFFFELTKVTNGTIDGAADRVEGIILDNDEPSTLPKLTVSGGGDVEEGQEATFHVTLDKATTVDVLFGFEFRNGTGDCLADLDICSSSGLIAAGKTQWTGQLTVVDDEVEEENETLSFVVWMADNATIEGTGSVPLTIIDNDGPQTSAGSAAAPAITIGSAPGRRAANP